MMVSMSIIAYKHTCLPPVVFFELRVVSILIMFFSPVLILLAAGVSSLVAGKPLLIICLRESHSLTMPHKEKDIFRIPTLSHGSKKLLLKLRQKLFCFAKLELKQASKTFLV